MLTDFLTRSLVALLGYAYPAFECYKTVEKNRLEIEQLRFWCQYWIIVALLTVFERFCDAFVSWLPMYGELKLGFIIYLWYPKTKGTTYVYETFLRPNIAQYETDIDRTLLEFKAKAWDLIILKWQNCVDYGQSAFFQILQFLASQSAKARDDPTQEKVAPPSPPPKSTVDSLVSRPPRAVQVQDHLPRVTTVPVPPDSDHAQVPADAQESVVAEALRAARTRLRRSRPF